MRVCVVATNYQLDPAREAGSDAQAIARELSTRTLKNRTPVTGIAITRVSKEGADSLVNRAECLYTVEVHRYYPPNNNVTLPGDLPGDVTLPEDPSPPWTPHDKDLILYMVRLVGSRKVLYSGSGLPPTSHGHGSAILTSYSAIVSKIVKTLNRGKLEQLNP
jgi:hypothetical protein